MKKHCAITLLWALGGLTACTVGPDYHRPSVVVPLQYKEAPGGWKMAQPQEACDRGKWWHIFNDDLLNQLEESVIISNQNIKSAEAAFRQAQALVLEARAAYFPVVTASGTATRQQNAGSTTFNTSNNTFDDTANNSNSRSTALKKSPVTNNFNLTLGATWEPDLWGLVRRSVEAAKDGAQASRAALALMQLSMQASLAQYYFELRGVEGDQKVLNNTVKNYQKLLKITENQYHAGIASQSSILQVKSSLALAEVSAMDTGILRAQYEHAIAVLTGYPPGCFSISPAKESEIEPPVVPIIPVELPSELLERRPDIAQSERLVAQANAQIGVAIAAYFPTLTLSGMGGFDSSLLKNLFTKPARFWSIAGALADTLFDGGLRSAQVAAARANYDQTVAVYRQTVLSAFQNVEDNLVALRILAQEIEKQNEAVDVAKKSLKVVMNEYQAGTAQLSDILNAELTLFTAEKGANDINYRRMTSVVGLIMALGGGWEDIFH